MLFKAWDSQRVGARIRTEPDMDSGLVQLPKVLQIDPQRLFVTSDLRWIRQSLLKGSFFDNDLKTRDKVAVDMAPTADGAKESREFEHYSEKKFILFTDERMNVKTSAIQEVGMSWSTFGREWNFSI